MDLEWFGGSWHDSPSVWRATMPLLAIDLVELSVGLVCLGVTYAAWRRGLPGVALVFAVAGGGAVGHAVWSMAT